MDKETVFREIRRGQVLLWAGAGFSRYAGYPMGVQVVERLYEELSSEQRQRLADSLGQTQPKRPEMTLPEFAQQFVNLHYGNRERLLEVIGWLFSAAPTARDAHDQLAAIAYIDAIVTTNYDSLFELAYGQAKLHVVTGGDHVPQIGRKPTTLFKIHGDLNRPRELIISKDDYYRFFEKADDLVWTQLKALMSTRTIVFVGYAVEDPNVLDVFLNLVDKLGVLMRPAFVVGPFMHALRIEELRRKNIHFIQATAEQFVEELVADIKKKALSELTHYGHRVLAPFSQTLSNMGLDFNLQLSGSSPLINSIRRRDGPTNVEFSFSTDSTDLQRVLQEFEESRKPTLLQLPVGELHSLSHKIEGFTLPIGTLSSLWIAQAPNIEEVVTVRFESGLLLADVEVYIYKNQNTMRKVALSKSSRIDVCFSFLPAKTSQKSKSSVDIKYNLSFSRRADTFTNVGAAIESTRTMEALGNLEKIEVFGVGTGQLLWKSGLFHSKKIKSLKKEAADLLPLVQALPLIERKFGIMFQHFNLVGQDLGDLVKLNYLLGKRRINANKGELAPIHIANCPEEYVKYTESDLFKKKSAYISYEREMSQDFTILGWTLRLIWVQKEYLFNPIFEKLDGVNNYKVHSRIHRMVYECLSIVEATVIQAAQVVTPPSLTEEEQIKERFPL